MNTFKVVLTSLCLFLTVSVFAHTPGFPLSMYQDESQDVARLIFSSATDDLPYGNSYNLFVTGSAYLLDNEWIVIVDEWGTRIIDDGNNDCVIAINATNPEVIDIVYQGDCGPQE